jgi:hypothetical protein
MLQLYSFIVCGEFIQDLCHVSIIYLEGLILIQLSHTFLEACQHKLALGKTEGDLAVCFSSRSRM